MRSPRLRALASLATVVLTGSCTYDFAQFEGLGPPVDDDAGQGGRGGGRKDASADASVPDGKAGQGGSSTTGGSGRGGAAGGTTGGSGGATGGTGGGTGGSGGTGATGGLGGSSGTGGSGTGGAGGASGKAGASGAGGTSGSSGAGGAVHDASTDGSDGTGGATGGTGGTTGGTGGSAGASGGTGGSGGATGGAGGSAGASGGTGGSGGASTADASDVNPPPDVRPDNRILDVAVDAPFDCTAVKGTVYQGHCYYPRSVAVDWNTANTTTCEAPAHLATITSAGEQAIVAALLPNQDRWIGMRRPANSPEAESSFYWVTSEPLSYRSWEIYSDADKEPNYTGECVRMRFTSMWADVACTEALAVICEHD
jgi:hypothetical protein